MSITAFPRRSSSHKVAGNRPGGLAEVYLMGDLLSGGPGAGRRWRIGSRRAGRAIPQKRVWCRPCRRRRGPLGRGALNELRAFLRIEIDAEGRPLVTQIESEPGFEMEISTALGPVMAGG